MRHHVAKLNRFRRGGSLPAIIALVVSLLTITVFAYLSITSSLTNILKPAGEVTPTISDYQVKVGDTSYTVYVRAAVTVNWVNGSNGNVHALVPAVDTDYVITFDTGDTGNWFYKDGFYYYKTPVASKGQTSALISDFSLTGTAPDGYSLKLTMTAQTIQAKGATDGNNSIPAVEDAWKSVTVDSNGNLIPKT